MERRHDPRVPTRYRADLIRAADGACWSLSCASHQRGCDQAAQALASIQKLMAPRPRSPGKRLRIATISVVIVVVVLATVSLNPRRRNLTRR